MLAALASPAGCYQGLDMPRSDDPSAGGTDGSDSAGDETGGSSSDTSEPEPTPGPMAPLQPLHRLNRLEYDNTVRDLLGTSLRPAQVFGPDPEANGFDNMAAQLSMSPAQLDAYAKAARDVVDDALDDRPVFSAEFASTELDVAGGYPVGDLWGLLEHSASAVLELPAEQQVEIVLTAGASIIGPAPTPTIDFEVDGAIVASFTVGGSAAIPVEHVHPMSLPAGPHTIRIIPTSFMNDAVANTSNNVMVLALEVRSVELTHGPGRDLVYVCEPAGSEDDGCYADIIEAFAYRAWRRPLTADERAGLLDLFAQIRAGGEAPSDALRIVMRALMTSPKFLYRARSTGDADEGAWLDDYVLASRLSYFLWSSMPDEHLFQMAEQGELATDEGLSEAVAWMLEDDKAGALLDGFAEQWLSVRHLAHASPSPETFPEFDEPLRAAMMQESKLFFGDFLDNALPVADFVQPDFAYRNDRLATHYGAPAVGSDELVRVAANDGDRRGLLMLGAWLTAESDSERASPIKRGRWVSDRLLCAPVPPPPPGLEFEPPDLGGTDSVREQLEKHREDPSCAGCHILLDEIGIGFEEMNGVGRDLLDPQIDNLGMLPDGRTFNGAAELSDLYAQSEDFVGCITQKLFTYAVGRAPTSFDREHLDEIGQTALAEGWDLPTLIDAIVHTPGFRSPAPLTHED